jgi:ABC-2 type transport system permease protein
VDKKTFFGGKALRYGGYSVIVTAIVLVALILLNLGMSLLPSAYTKPATDGTGMYDISDTSRHLAENVKDSVTLYIVCYEEYLDPTVQEYVRRYADLNRNLKVEHIDPSVHPTFLSQHLGEDETLDATYTNVLVVNNDRDRAKAITYSEMYRFDYSEQDWYYYQMYGVHTEEPIATYFQLEGKLTSAVHYVTLEKLPTLYYTKGHSEVTLDAYAATLADQQNVSLKELDLATAEKVPDDADGLLILAPSKDFTAEEVAKLTAYADKGGVVMLSTYYRSSAEDRNLPNLFAFAETYGLGYKDALICEGNSSFHPTNYPFRIYPQLSGNFKTWANDSRVMMHSAHGITVNKVDGVTVTELMATTVQGFAKTELPEKGNIVKEEGDEDGRFVIGALAEKKNDGVTSKLYWFGSYSVFDIQGTIQQYGNPYLFMGLLIDTCEIEYPTVEPTLLSVEYLSISGKASTVWSVILIGLIPVGVVVGGFLVWRRRLTR